MKNLKHKILAGIFSLATLGFLENKNLSAQSVDTLDKIFINYTAQQLFNNTEIQKAVFASGYKYGSIKTRNTKDRSFSVACYDKNNDGNYEQILIFKDNQTINERFDIHFETSLIDYKLDYWSEESQWGANVIEFKNLTKEGIYQDSAFAERTKRIINSCKSEEKLKEMVKEVYKEKNIIKIPQIKQK